MNIIPTQLLLVSRMGSYHKEQIQVEFLYGCLFDQKDMQNYIIILPLQVWDAKCIKRHQVKGKLPQFSSQPVHFALHNTPVLVKKRRKK